MSDAIDLIRRHRRMKAARRVLRSVGSVLSNAEISVLAKTLEMQDARSIEYTLTELAQPESSRLGVILSASLPEDYALADITPALLVAASSAAASGGALSVEEAENAVRGLGLPPEDEESLIDRIVALGDGALTFASVGALLSEFEVGAAAASRIARFIPGPAGLVGRIAPFILPLLGGLLGLATDSDVTGGGSSGALPSGSARGAGSGRRGSPGNPILMDDFEVYGTDEPGGSR